MAHLIQEIYTLMYSHSSNIKHEYFYGIGQLCKEFGVPKLEKNKMYDPWTKKEWRKLMTLVDRLDKMLPRHYYVYRLYCDLARWETCQTRCAAVGFTAVRLGVSV